MTAEVNAILVDAKDYILHKAARHDLNWRDGHAIIDRIDAMLASQEQVINEPSISEQRAMGVQFGYEKL